MPAVGDTMPNHYPVIVIGGGTMGSAAAWALGKRGVKALVLEQFGHVHTFGAHSGRTRIFRHAYAESPDYVPLVLRADDLWQELEAILRAAGSCPHRRTRPGGAGIRSRRRGTASCEAWDLPFEWLSGTGGPGAVARLQHPRRVGSLLQHPRGLPQGRAGPPRPGRRRPGFGRHNPRARARPDGGYRTATASASQPTPAPTPPTA